MNTLISVALIIVGVVLLIFGFAAGDSASSHASNFFTGQPTNRTLLLIAGGALCAVVGLVGTFRTARTH